MDDEQRKKIRIEILEESDADWHMHSDIELDYCLAGTLQVRQKNNTAVLHAGDILMVNANRSHILQGESGVLYMKLSIQYQLIGDILKSPHFLFICDSTANQDPAYAELRRLLNQLLSHYVSSRENAADFVHISMCYSIMAYLCGHFLLQTNPEDESPEEKFQNRIDAINGYISQNFRENASIKELAERMYLSTGYLSRFSGRTSAAVLRSTSPRSDCRRR